MKKQKRYIVIGILLFLVATCYYFLNREEITDQQKDASNKPSEEVGPDSSRREQEDAFYEGLFDKYGKAPDGLEFSAWRRILLTHEYGLRDNTDILFYGKVVNQYGEPVQGVKLGFELSGYNESILKDFLLDMGRDKDKSARLQQLVEVETNATGLFTISNYRGQSLRLQVIDKEGYIPSEIGNPYHYGSAFSPTDCHHPDPKNPVVFTMWKKGETEELVKGDGFYGVEPNGEKETIDLLKDKICKAPNEGGDIAVSLVRGIENESKKYDWTFTLEAVNGGVILSKDPFGYGAPEEGYQPKYEISMKAEDPNWSSRFDQKYRFYIKSRNGEVYSTVYLKRLYALYGSDREGVFEIEWLSNPKGSRNLEYDPAKDVTKKYNEEYLKREEKKKRLY